MFIVVKVRLSKEFAQSEVESLTHFATSECECSGVEEYSLEEVQVDELLGDRAYSGGNLPIEVLDEVETSRSEKDQKEFKFYFTGKGLNLDAFENYLIEHGLSYSLEEHEESDWDAEWKKSYTPVAISADLWIVPEWMKDQHDAKTSIYINPGQGFGTGKHETTYLCLKLMLKTPMASLNNVLDLGCGSGILGAALLKFSNPAIDFCDIDKNALSNTVQNLSLNFARRDLSKCTLILRDRLMQEKNKYDLIFANILLSALQDECGFISTSLKSGGHLICSGLLNDQADEFKELYSSFEILEVMSKGDWTAILLRKK
jgi:ribosomal protein L11 methyltransferase